MDQTEGDIVTYWKKPNYKLLAAGTLKAQKDFTMLIRAIDKVNLDKPVSLIILGEGPEREHLEKLIISLNLKDQIKLPGYVMDPSPYFEFADIFILSSAWEGFGNVLVEALEKGTPVVSTDCKSGPSEILDGGKYGALVPVNDHNLCAHAIEETLTRKHDKQMLIERSKLFSVNKISMEYLDYFGASK